MNDLPDEYSLVEEPLIEQLKAMGWEYLEGDTGVPYLTERESFRQVLLTDRLRKAVRRINLIEGKEWLDDSRINKVVGELERLGATKLMEANQRATELLLRGTVVEGLAEIDGGRGQPVHFIDFEHPDRNEFLAINQFRVDPLWGVADKDFIVPDIVLFVNGIPLVVVECKSPAITNPMEEGIKQLLRYSNQREEVEEEEGAERLFHYDQFMVSTCFHEARVGTIGASYEHYFEWKDTCPVSVTQVARELGKDDISSQETLVAGMLRKEHLLDIIRNFTLFKEDTGRTIKILARYQQFRAVYRAIRRLLTGQTRLQDGEFDRRGGVIWHTQGSGKSLTMVFLIRKMRATPELRRFKVVVVTDRIDLDKQLRDTAKLTGETVLRAKAIHRLKELLKEEGPGLVFGLIQKYQDRDLAGERERDVEPFPVLNESEDILVLVDEAHRSHTSSLHANLMRALPNCAKIGFTGTPIIAADKKKTHEIFGEFIDCYTIQQSQEDGTTLRILYEGRTAEAAVSDGRELDELFEDMFSDKTRKELEAIKAKYATEGDVLEAPKLIAAKAKDILCHYVDNILPNRFKAQVVAVSRLAAVRYHEAFLAAQQELVAKLEGMDASMLSLSEEELAKQDDETQFLVRAHAHLKAIKELEFAVVISGDRSDPRSWKEWTERGKQELRIEQFKRPFEHKDPEKRSSLAFLIVKSMLLVGFDAPVEQVLYLDRKMKDHELLQTIARANRRSSGPGKSRGFVVDYYGVAQHLREALEAYSTEDVVGAFVSINDELPRLESRHRRVLAVFYDKGIEDINDTEACVHLLRDERIRADFTVKLRQFLESLEIVLPRPEALPYVQDAMTLGFINKSAANLYRDSQLNILGAGQKVRELIDTHIEAKGIDPTVEPISITDVEFEGAVNRRVSDRAKASEMEFAARHYIKEHFREDPAYYKKLSERLEEILQQLKDNWAELVRALRKFVGDVRAGRPADKTGLDPRTQAPFLGILVEEVSGDEQLPEEQLDRLAELTVEIVDRIRQEIQIVDFWRNPHAQDLLRKWICRFLDDHELLPFERLEVTADRLVQVAKALHVRLTS